MSDYDTDYDPDGGDESLNYNPRKSIGVNLSDLSFDDPFTLANLPAGSGLFDIEGNLNLENTLSLINDRDLFTEFAKLFPDDAALLSDITLPTEQGFKEYVSQDSSGLTEPPERTGVEGAGFPGEGIKSGVKEWDDAAKKAGVELTDPNASTGLDTGDLAKYLLPALASYLSYKSAKDAQQEAKGASFGASGPVTATRRAYEGSTYKPAAQGGIMSLAGGGSVQPMYFGGSTDGMADEVPAHIDGKRPAALSDGEFVIPADVVSHLGNGNSNAGAQRLYKMMDDIREARTGNRKQGIEINPNNFMPR